MKKILLLFPLLIFGSVMDAKADGANTSIDEVWKEFRVNHPFGFQTVGVKHIDDEQLFVISEPSERISYQSVDSLFGNYGGTITVKKSPLGYDGWLADIVGSIKFNSEVQENEFKRNLFNLLYCTDYKAYYTNLDNPSPHSFFAPYKYKLNYSITAKELESWLVEAGETFCELSEQGVLSTGKPITEWISNSEKDSNKLLYSQERGFVVWLTNPSNMTNNNTFRINARKFALDTDLIIGAFGVKGKTVAIVARERQVPVDILPPLRVETLLLLATTDNESLAQSYERYNIFANKLPSNEDVAPIYLSDELWHTEYGNLLNVTDQMLKSWSENGRIDYKAFNHPKPIDWAFESGAVRDLDANELTYNWNTAGAGYVIEGDSYDIFAVNRTGSLPVSYIPGGMEGKVDQTVYDAEELAYDFFSGLNSPELARVVQYATFYQIFSYFKGDNKGTVCSTSSKDDVVPDYGVFYGYVERLLQMAKKSPLSQESDDYKTAMTRFAKRYRDNNAHTRLKNLLENDPYGEFAYYLQQTSERERFDSILQYSPTDAEIEKAFWEYLTPNMDTIQAYIRTYERAYGTFPIQKAARFIVSPHELIQEINEKETEEVPGMANYQRRVDRYNARLDTLRKESADLSEKIDEFNKKVNARTANMIDKFLLELEQKQLKEKFDNLNLERKAIDLEESGILKALEQRDKSLRPLLYLGVNDKQQQALGALNWLLTDPAPYSIPSGEFFACRLTTHRQWMKSPSMACSTNKSGYGGHNLDAHVTPVKTAVGLEKDQCKITFKDGKRVISVAKENIPRVTRSFLRRVERQINNDQIIPLPNPPKNRGKDILVASNTLRQERGFDIATHNSAADIPMYAYNKRGIQTQINELQLIDELRHQGHSKATIEPYSEREILVKQGDTEFIVERSGNLDSENAITFEDIQGEVVGDQYVVELTSASSDGVSRQATILTFPKVLYSASSAIENAIRSFPGKIENLFKLKSKIRKSIDVELFQDVEIGIKRNFFNTIDLQNEYDLQTVIIRDNDEYILFPFAA